MKPEEIVVSLEWAKKLKEAGWQERTFLHWDIRDGKAKRSNAAHDFESLAFVNAPTAEEILRRLPWKLWIDGADRILDTYPHHFRNPDIWELSYEGYYWQRDESLANAAAAMYCYLAEQKLLPSTA